MAANVDAMVREGMSALKAGNRDEARALLMKAVELDQFNEQGWLWLSAVVDTLEDQATCLENVLAINASNERARQGLQYIEQQRKGGASPEPAPSTPPAAKQSLPAPPPPQASEPASGAQPVKTDMPTSVEWAAPDSEPSPPTPPKRPLELSEDEYDSWVNTLNLPTTTPKRPETPFVDEDDEVVDLSAFEEFAAQSKSASQAADARKTNETKTKEPKQKQPKAQPVVQQPEPEPEYEPLFPEIPEEIKATRVPGTVQRMPILIILLLVVVLAANVAAAVLLVQSLTAG